MQQAAAQPAHPPSPDLDVARIFKENASRVLSAAYRVTGNSQDAEDVLQTVFMRLVRRDAATWLSNDPRAYLHRAAVNAGLDVVRSRKAARSTPLEDVEPVLREEDGRGPDDVLGGSELREHVRKALTNLSPRSAEIFALRYFEGYDNHEIADMLNTSRSTVAVILHRARNSVREKIAPLLKDATDAGDES
jgi:RNA polymerase sigma-70 factor (ECF subfamily)